MVKLVPYNPSTIRVPVYAQISAGLPLEDCPQIGWRDIRKPRGFRETKQYCAVRVNGESLRDAAILSGDFAICWLTPALEFNGQLSAVLVNGGITLKYVFYGSENMVRLEARNPAYLDRWVEADEIGIQAVVVRIERDL